MGFSTFGKIGVATMGIVAASAFFPGAAFALGAGDNYRVGNTGEESIAACSVNSVHTDPDTGKHYMLTAGHCVDPKASDGELKEGRVVAYDRKTGREIGRVIGHDFSVNNSNSDSRDWAVIELNDNVKLDKGVDSRFMEVYTGNLFPASKNLPLDGRVSHAAAGERVYRDGGTSGRTAGVVLDSADNGEAIVLTWALPGDSGGVLHDGKGTNLGVTSRSAVYLPLSVYNHTDAQVAAAEAETGVNLGTTAVSPEDRNATLAGPLGSVVSGAGSSSFVINQAVDTAFAVDDTLVGINDATGGSVDNAHNSARQFSKDAHSVANTAKTNPTGALNEANVLINKGVNDARADVKNHVNTTAGQLVGSKTVKK